MAMVTILEKSDGVWSSEEIIKLEEVDVVVERMFEQPRKLVAINKPSKEKTFQTVLGHAKFRSEEVEESKAWE